MKKYLILLLCGCFLSACSTLSYQEKNTIRSLKTIGVSVDRPLSPWDKPASPLSAGLLNILPGIGNFYLASGNAGDASHYIYGFANFLLWPISVLWAVPEAAIDANLINQKEFAYYFIFDETGKKALAEKGYELQASGQLVALAKK